jgi:hypothetical protein
MSTFSVLRPAGYAFSTYGEVAACWVQDIVLVGLIARHMRTGHKRLAAAAAAFTVYCWWLVSGLCSVETLTGADSQRPSMADYWANSRAESQTDSWGQQ